MERLRKIRFQRLDAGVSMRLEYCDYPPVARKPRRFQRSHNFRRVMPVIVYYQDIVFPAFDLKPSVGVLERFQSGGNGFKRNVQFQARGYCGQRIQNSVFAGNLQTKGSQGISLVLDPAGASKIPVPDL